MLEFGEYRGKSTFHALSHSLYLGNLYGTCLSSVRACREMGTPLLCPHPLALVHLRTPEFAPFIVFIEPPDAVSFKVTIQGFTIFIVIVQETRSASVRGVKTAPSFTSSQIQQARIFLKRFHTSNEFLPIPQK